MGAIGLLTVMFVNRSTIGRLAEGTSSDTFVERTTAWRIGLDAWRETPLLGVGAGSYDDITAPKFRRMAAHNTVVSVLVETGLIGFVLYFSFWAIVVRRIMFFPKTDRFYWLGVFATFLPLFLTLTQEYAKVLWFLGGLVLCQKLPPNASSAKKEKMATTLAPLPGAPLLKRPYHS